MEVSGTTATGRISAPRRAFYEACLSSLELAYHNEVKHIRLDLFAQLLARAAAHSLDDEHFINAPYQRPFKTFVVGYYVILKSFIPDINQPPFILIKNSYPQPAARVGVISPPWTVYPVRDGML